MLKEWTDVLLLHLVRDARTIDRLTGKVEPRDISDLTMDSTRGFLWKLSRDYYAQAQQPIPQHFLVAGLCDRIQQDNTPQDEVDSAAMLIDDIYAVPAAELNSEAALGYAKRLLEEVRVNRPVQELLSDGGNITQIFETFQAGLSAASVSMAEPINPMAEWRSMLGTVKPVPLGGAEVKYFNMLVNGGLCPGEIVIVMGPMGGFKTTIAIDVVCSMAKIEKQNSLFLAYEQSYKGGDLPIRFMSRLSGIDRDILMNTPHDQLSEENQKIMDEAYEHGKHALFLDRSQSADKVSDIAAMVRDLADSGRKPELIIIDQLMTWMGLWPESRSTKSDDWFRKNSTQVIKDLKQQVCEKYGTRMVVLHQITAGAIKGKKGKSFGHTESAENKGLGFWSDFVITIGTKDENDVFKAVAGKTRRGPNNSHLVQALPKTCRFRYADDYDEGDTGGFTKKGQRTMIPTGSIDTSKMKGSQTSI
jgi:hypothetical protein